MAKAKKYSRWSKRIERNILIVYHLANEQDREDGLLWYQQAHEIASNIAAKHGVTVAAAIGVLAALSPGNPWGRNILEADEFIGAWAKGLRNKDLPQVGIYGKGNIAKCVKILGGSDPLDVLGGLKVRSFYQLILDPKNSREVCIDRHAKCIGLMAEPTRAGFASSDKHGLVRPAEYPYFARHYATVADRLGLLPHQLQAVTWCAWRRLKGQVETEAVPF